MMLPNATFLHFIIFEIFTKIWITDKMEDGNTVSIEQTVKDNILLLKKTMKIIRTQRAMNSCFVDLSKAFDSVPLDKAKASC